LSLRFQIETDREDDGRWIAEAVGLPGVLAYGNTRDEAIRHVEALALCVIADRVESNDVTERAMSVPCGAS
jgi:predicted RNase H-like HicB family nuclease